MTLNEDVTKAKELYSSANESEFAVPTTQYTLKDAVFLMLRATATKMDLIPEISDDIRQAYELYKEVDESEWADPTTQYNLMDACYHLAKAIQERTE